MKATHLFAVLSLVSTLPAVAAETASPEHLRRLNIACEFRREAPTVTPENERFTACKALAAVTVRAEGVEVENNINKLAIACTERGEESIELVYAGGTTVTKIRHEGERLLKLQATGAETPKILIKLERESMENASSEGLRALLVLGEHQKQIGECVIRRDDRPSLD